MTSILRVDSIQTAAGGSATASGLGIGGVGKIGQVVNVNKTDTFNSSSGSYVDVTGLSASITPSATTSKIFVNLTLYVSNDTQTSNTFAKIVRDSTGLQESINRVPQEAQAVYRTYNISMTHLDSPSSTSALTYKFQAKQILGGAAIKFNTGYSSANSYQASFLTAMEVLV